MANYTSDLDILSKSRKVTLSNDSSEDKVDLILHPFIFKNFRKVVSLIKKYWDCYVKVGEIHEQGMNEIIEETVKDETSHRRELLAENYDNHFNEAGLIVQNLLARDDENLAEDVETLIGFSLRQDFDLQSLNIGEITMILIAVIEVNMDFFDQNLDKLSLLKAKKAAPKMLKVGEQKLAA